MAILHIRTIHLLGREVSITKQALEVEDKFSELLIGKFVLQLKEVYIFPKLFGDYMGLH